jgi:hypothetical protein
MRASRTFSASPVLSVRFGGAPSRRPLRKGIKPTRLAALAALWLTGVLAMASALAQTVPDQPPLPSVLTRILAIGHLTATRTQAGPLLPSEVRATLRLYLDGKIDQWFAKPDETVVVFLMNVPSEKDARDLLEKLPLGQAGFMKFELIPLGPLSPLGLLLAKPAP